MTKRQNKNNFWRENCYAFLLLVDVFHVIDEFGFGVHAFQTNFALVPDLQVAFNAMLDKVGRIRIGFRTYLTLESHLFPPVFGFDVAL